MCSDTTAQPEMKFLPTEIPSFSFNFTSPQRHGYGCIVAENFSYRVDDFSELYAEFGYADFLKRLLIHPEEFIWEHYTRAGKEGFAACKQMHIVNFLHKKSAEFSKKFGHLYSKYVEDHALAREQRGSSCVACKSQRLIHSPT